MRKDTITVNFKNDCSQLVHWFLSIICIWKHSTFYSYCIWRNLHVKFRKNSFIKRTTTRIRHKASLWGLPLISRQNSKANKLQNVCFTICKTYYIKFDNQEVRNKHMGKLCEICLKWQYIKLTYSHLVHEFMYLISIYRISHFHLEIKLPTDEITFYVWRD